MVDSLHDLSRDVWLRGAGADAWSQCHVNPVPMCLLLCMGTDLLQHSGQRVEPLLRPS